MPDFAAIDVGSNASRLLIVSARSPKDVQVKKTLRVPVRLGHAVFQTGRLDLRVVDECVEAMRTFSAAMADAQVDSYRAIVTASARAARNADLLFERVREEAGITLVGIDGVEEARLVALAISQAMKVHAPGLLMDLGGGSLELSKMDHPEAFTESLPIGTVRLLEAFLREGEVVSARQRKLLDDFLDRTLAPYAQALGEGEWASVVGSGGNLETAAELCPAEPAGKVPAIDLEAAKRKLDELAAIPPEERAERYGFRRDRADVIVPALFVITKIAELAGVSRVEVPGVGLKEGVAFELVSKHFRVWDYTRADNEVFAAAIQLGRRYHFDERHARQVARLSLDLFDAMQEIHGLGKKSRAILNIAAILHDVGDFVSPRGHHKHTQYIIEHSTLMGLTPETQQLISLIARYHRRAAPTPRHAPYRALSARNRDRVKSLAAILRVADALDRGHQSKIDALEIQVHPRSVTLRAAAKRDLSLEAWTVDRKGQLFQDVFGREPVLKFTAPRIDGELY